MSKYSDLTINQIRSALDSMELNYNLAMDANDYGLAGAFKSKIDLLMAELVLRLVDPYTTEADVRYFETEGR